MKGNKIQQAEGKLLRGAGSHGLRGRERHSAVTRRLKAEAEAASRNLQIALLRFCFSTETLLFVHIVHLI